MEWLNNLIGPSAARGVGQIIGINVAFIGVLMIVAYTVLAERRILGFIQGRLGPNRVGPGGLFQPFADLLKFIFKEEITPSSATRFVYFLAPVIGITVAGWSSNSKYSLMGALRAASQMISYELSLGLSLIGVVLMSGTLDLYSIVEQQGGWGGMRWNIIRPDG